MDIKSIEREVMIMVAIIITVLIVVVIQTLTQDMSNFENQCCYDDVHEYQCVRILEQGIKTYVDQPFIKSINLKSSKSF